MGWTEGRNIEFDARWIGGDLANRAAHAAELVAGSPDVIFACFSAQLAALSRETKSIPIVFAGVSDPVGTGFAASFARPGGNITGFTFFEPSMGGKWLEALKEVAPGIARVAILFNPETATGRGALIRKSFDSAATVLSIEALTAAVRSVGEIEAAMAALSQNRDSGVVVAPDTFTELHRDLIIALAARHRLPAVYNNRNFTKSGGLMSYGPDIVDTVRRTASYIDRILRGERPADLPIQAPTRFDLSINLRTARALGLDLPATLIARADEVIE